MRALATVGVFDEPGDGVFALAPLIVPEAPS
jgi:hypothetical protein